MSTITDGEFTPEVEDVYLKLTLLEHILVRPDSYVGSITHEEHTTWILDQGTASLQLRSVSWVPALLKIFDEILVNATDNRQRQGSGMTTLKVDIDATANRITVWNDGFGIPVQWHKEYGCYVPELILGQLLTSSNYKDDEKKTVGGRNGYGAKLANIFSRAFAIDTVDTRCEPSQHYTQNWSDNMKVRAEPRLRPAPKKARDYTRVTFQPDLTRLGVVAADGSVAQSLTADVVALMQKRVYDMAGTCHKLKVFYNGERVKVSSFRDYVRLHLGGSPPAAAAAMVVNGGVTTSPPSATAGGALGAAPPPDDEDLPEVVCRAAGPTAVVPGFVLDAATPRWEVAVAVSTTGDFQQVSFVNNIHTLNGGTHVKYVLSQLLDKILAHFNQRKGAAGKPPLKARCLQKHLCLFVNCLIENPTFDSQTKVHLTSKSKDFGSTWEPSDVLVGRLFKTTTLEERLLALTEGQQAKAFKKLNGKKTSRLTGIEKLDDANLAGGRHASECTLILTEGDSAKALAVAGMGVVGRDFFGIYPLKGKLLNVRNASQSTIVANREIAELFRIMGFQIGATYTDTQQLRYGRIMFMCDQDLDGSHIKGLLVNLIATLWPSLLRVPNFLSVFMTPIIRVFRGLSPVQTFYTLAEYERWRLEADPVELQRLRIKYYKGLGTSSSEEAKEYFRALERHQIFFTWGSERCDQALAMAFSNKCAEQRKRWLEAFVPGVVVQSEEEEVVGAASTKRQRRTVTFESFVHRELILFSLASNRRSLPSVIDGLKPGQRKILYACFKRRLVQEVKVAQLAGYVAEHAVYHHAEKSLSDTIVGMAQDFVGQHNLPLLVGRGQFGTRLAGGKKDAASERYIFTLLSPLASALFMAEDAPVLDYEEQDGEAAEPTFYVPLLPMVLVNGAFGMGTAWSCQVPKFSPRQIVQQLQQQIGVWRSRRPSQQPEQELLSSSSLSHGAAAAVSLSLSAPSDQPLWPWYRGFRGPIQSVAAAGGGGSTTDPTTFTVEGVVTKTGPLTFHITELPLRCWTNKYLAGLRELLTGSEPLVRKIEENHTDTLVDFKVTLVDEAAMATVERQGAVSFFNLAGTQYNLSLTNMNLFDARGRLRSYPSVRSILDEFFQVRMDCYTRRKAHALDLQAKDLCRCQEKYRFIGAVIAGTIVVQRHTKAELTSVLEALQYSPCPTIPSSPYEHLIGLPIYSFTTDRLAALARELERRTEELRLLEAQDEADLYEADLRALLPLLPSEQDGDGGVVTLSKVEKVGAPFAAATKKKRRLAPSLSSKEGAAQKRGKKLLKGTGTPVVFAQP